MAVATADTIKTQILTGTYPENTINDNNVYDYEQYDKRRRYPSCEVWTTQPESTIESKKTTETTVGFEIRYYVKNLGLRSAQITSQKDVEAEIMRVIEAMTLQDNKVVLESKVWAREQVGRFGGNFPSYIVSVLRITVRQITPSTATADGVLVFKNGSVVDNDPEEDYEYSEVFDVDLIGGYRNIPEKYTSSNVPKYYAGNFEGRLICNVPVKADDLGTTGDKLNKLITLRATTGETPDINFVYTNKTGGTSPSTITETFTVKPESLQRLYRYQDTVVYRFIGLISAPSAITVS
jgi:hypothetical protein